MNRFLTRGLQLSVSNTTLSDLGYDFIRHAIESVSLLQKTRESQVSNKRHNTHDTANGVIARIFGLALLGPLP